MGHSLAGFLSALQLCDSGFPSGRYTLSYGLESFAQHQRLSLPALTGLLQGSILDGVAPSDGIALACVHRAGDDLDTVIRVDERLTAVKIAREARETSARTGRALLATATAAFDLPWLQHLADNVREHRTPGNHAVVLGVLSAALAVPLVEAVAGELYAFSAGWLAAAVRLALIDHRTAQSMLHQMRPVIAAASAQAAAGEIGQIASCTPLLDVMSMRHEQAELRLFAS